MATNRAMVAVSVSEDWLWMVVKGYWVEHEQQEVGKLDHIDGFDGLPQGLSVLDFDLTFRPSYPDDCDVNAVNVTARRPTSEEVAALNTDDPSALHALWADVSSENAWADGQEG
jgi:hypothetical protein